MNIIKSKVEGLKLASRRSGSKVEHQSGQVLLITVMLLATVLTVVFAVSFKSTADTQTAKLEEESQKALAAAQAGIEEAIRTGNVTALAGGDYADFTISANFNTTTTSTFTSPLLQQDEIYTFYLSTVSDPNKPDYSTLTPSYPNNTAVTLCFGTESTAPALEVTLIKTGGAIQKYVISSTDTSIASATGTAATPASVQCPSGETFSHSYQLSGAQMGSNNLFLLVRVIGSGLSTKVGFQGSTFPLQGRTVSSSATSTTGVTKKVELFQSYSQFPAEFFVTSF